MASNGSTRYADAGMKQFATPGTPVVSSPGIATVTPSSDAGPSDRVTTIGP